MSNDTQTVTLTEFLLSRIAEDEAGAMRYSLRHWQAVDDYSVKGDSGVAGSERPDATTWGICRTAAKSDAEFIARHDPARVLAECEAKRRIVEAEPERWPAEMNGTSAHDEWEWTLQRLAVVYADHPDYDEAWRP